MVEQKIPINVSLLCDFIEKICGSIVVSLRLQSRSTLHDITLPKSWLMDLWRDIETSHTRDARCYLLLVDPLVSLIQRIFVGSNTGNLSVNVRLTYLLIITVRLSTL